MGERIWFHLAFHQLKVLWHKIVQKRNRMFWYTENLVEVNLFQFFSWFSWIFRLQNKIIYIFCWWWSYSNPSWWVSIIIPSYSMEISTEPEKNIVKIYIFDGGDVLLCNGADGIFSGKCSDHDMTIIIKIPKKVSICSIYWTYWDKNWVMHIYIHNMLLHCCIHFSQHIRVKR